MYNENTNFSIKNLIVQFLFIALFVFILIWLFPLKSDIKNLNSGNDNNLSVLVDRIFNENIIAMKDAAKSYYTTPRLPQKVGDKVKMTLGEMLEKKIILPFTDKNGDTCSLTDSYVEITKYEEEYVMKVNLKCGEEENYLLVYMGCYDYCTTDICEKNESDVKAPVIYPTEKHYCEIINSVFYDNKGNIVSKKAYENACIKKPEVVKYYCKVVGNNFYDANGNIVSESAYQASCFKPEEKYYCKVVNSKFYDNNGNVVSEAAYQAACIKYKYEYKKTTPAVCTEFDWSDWSTTKATASATVSVQTKDVTESKLIGYNVKTALDKTKPIYGTKEVETGLYETKDVCTSYGYVNTGEYSYGEWTYVETVYLNYSPTNTETESYVKVDENSYVCGENCAAGTTKAYKKYERKATPITKYQCTNWETKSVPITTTVQYITGYERVVISKTPVYKDTTTTYYRTKTKTCTKESTDIKYSDSDNDKNLLDAGYVYTGNKFQK